MTLLNPLALALAAFAVPIVLMYVLKLRRTQHVVSSTILWQRALDDLQANAPWQRLRPSVLLLLQLLALLALVLALAGPAYTSSHHVAGDLIVIVDESYGMQAHDITPTRFAAAIARAHSAAADLPSGNVASIIGMGAQPDMKIAESSDGGAINRAIDRLRPGVSSPNFLGALSLAASLARTGQTTRVIVLTSRESGISTLPMQVTFPVEIVRIGSNTLHDLGITAFNAVRDRQSVRALVRVANFGRSSAGSDLDLYVDGQLADVRPLQVDPSKQQTLFWTNLPANAHTLEVHLARHDDVDTDKTAWAVTGATGQRRVLLVTKNDYFVQTALALDPTVQVSTVTPAGYRPSVGQGYDLVAFDSMLPSALPATPILILSPPAGHARVPAGDSFAFGKFVSGGAMSASSATSTSAVASILQFVDLSDVHVARLRQSSLPGWMLPIVTTRAGSTLLAAGETNGRRMAVAAFDLQESDWPLRISFPLVMQNLLHYLAPGLSLAPADTTSGQTVQLLPAARTKEIHISRPDGSTVTIQPPFAPFADTAQVGVYTATTIGDTRQTSVRFAVNFLPARPAAAIGRQDVVLGSKPSGSGNGSSRSASIPMGVGWACALAVLALLSAEWWFAFRR